jgi:hypothetical protein
MRQDASEQTVGVILDPVALRALDGQLHDVVEDLDALDRARAAVRLALQSLGDSPVPATAETPRPVLDINARVVGVSACATLGIGTIIAVIADTPAPHYRVHFDGQPMTALYFCRADDIRTLE